MTLNKMTIKIFSFSKISNNFGISSESSQSQLINLHELRSIHSKDKLSLFCYKTRYKIQYLFLRIFLQTSSTNWTFILYTEPLMRTFVMKKVTTRQSYQIRIQLIFGHTNCAGVILNIFDYEFQKKISFVLYLRRPVH